jgi:predicted RNA binding protein YcfA (HicA-like mRNA interferase family)
MKLPRDLSASQLEKRLRKTLGYEFSRQVGSHRRMTTQTSGEHYVTIPDHDPIKPGTLRAILGEVMMHHRLSMDEVLRRLDLA